MTKDSKEVNETAEKVGNFFFTGKRQEAFWFWLVGLGIVIPAVTYGSTMLIDFLLALVLGLIGISSGTYSKPIALGIDAGCAAVSLYGYYRLWVLYSGKRSKKKAIT
jgi:hypothetical protein